MSRKGRRMSVFGLADVPMSHHDALSNLQIVILAELALKMLGNRYRTMAASGAPNSDGQVALPLLSEPRQAKRKKRHSPLNKPLTIGLLEHVLGDVLVQTRTGAKLQIEVRIRQEADIEHEIGIVRNAVLEPKGKKTHTHLLRTIQRVVFKNPPAQIMDCQLGGIDHGVRSFPQR